jgi:hypothetical protein
MSWSGRKLAMAALVMMATRLMAQEGTLRADQQAYCAYVSEQAKAQQDLLRTPSAVSGVTQATAALPVQMFWGVTSSLSDIRKAGLTIDAAGKNCQLYMATTSSQQAIAYALPNLEKQALEHRLEMILQASDDLDTLTASATKMLEAQNVTRPMLFALQTTRIKLDADRAETQSKLAALYVPELNRQPIKELVAQKQAGEAAEQAVLDKLSRQSNWDVALSVGVRQQISPFDDHGLYGAVTVSYNLAGPAIDKHLDQAATAYGDWKTVQQGDVARNAEVLKQQLSGSLAAQQARLKSLQGEQDRVVSNLQLVGNVDTTAALDFRNQLTTTQLLLRIETSDAGFRIQELEDFLRKNY